MAFSWNISEKFPLMSQESDKPYLSLENRFELQAPYSRLLKSNKQCMKQITNNFCLVCLHWKKEHRISLLELYYFKYYFARMHWAGEFNSTKLFERTDNEHLADAINIMQRYRNIYCC